MKHKHESSRHVGRTRPQLCHIHKVHNVLTVLQLKTTWRLGNIQLVLIVAVVEVLLQEDSFHF